jgi:hypothetical protein
MKVRRQRQMVRPPKGLDMVKGASIQSQRPKLIGGEGRELMALMQLERVARASRP